MLWTSL